MKLPQNMSKTGQNKDRTTHKMFRSVRSEAVRCPQLLFPTLLCRKSPLFSIAEGCQSEYNGGRASAFG